MRRPEWKKNAADFFAKHYDNGAGSPKRIALACCEVAAYLAGTDVNTNAVQNGLAAGILVHHGEQPFENEGIIIDTHWPHDALTTRRSTNRTSYVNSNAACDSISKVRNELEIERKHKISPKDLAALLADE